MSEVIVLNASYEVLGVVPIRRAVAFILHERVDVIASLDGTIRSNNASMPTPLVVAFREYITIPFSAKHAVAPWSRNLMLRRDNHECAYCGKTATTVDHIHPRSRGGRNEWMNTIAACLSCNGKKGDKTLEQYGVPLRFPPQIVYRETRLSVALRERVTAIAPELIPVLSAA